MVSFVLQQGKECKLFFKIEREKKDGLKIPFQGGTCYFSFQGPEAHSHLPNDRLLENRRHWWHFTDECDRPLRGCCTGSCSQRAPSLHGWPQAWPL